MGFLDRCFQNTELLSVQVIENVILEEGEYTLQDLLKYIGEPPINIDGFVIEDLSTKIKVDKIGVVLRNRTNAVRLSSCK